MLLIDRERELAESLRTAYSSSLRQKLSSSEKLSLLPGVSLIHYDILLIASLATGGEGNKCKLCRYMCQVMNVNKTIMCAFFVGFVGVIRKHI